MPLSKRALVAVAIVAAVGFGATVASAAPILSIDVGSTVNAGGTVDAKINVSGATDLYAFQFDVGFFPSVVKVVSVAEGPFLGTAGATLFVPGTIDNVLGSVTFTSGTLLGPGPGASGNGTLATITLQGVAAGRTPLVLSNVIVLDSQLRDITVTTADGSASVVPEPGTLVLLSLGLAALRRRRV